MPKRTRTCRTCGHVYTGRICKNPNCPQRRKVLAARRANHSHPARVHSGWTGWGASAATDPAPHGTVSSPLPVNASAAACAGGNGRDCDQLVTAEHDLAGIDEHLAELYVQHRAWLVANPDACEMSPFFQTIEEMEHLREIYAEAECIAELTAIAIRRGYRYAVENS